MDQTPIMLFQSSTIYRELAHGTDGKASLFSLCAGWSHLKESFDVIPAHNKAIALKAFDTLFNTRDYTAAERFWSPNQIKTGDEMGNIIDRFQIPCHRVLRSNGAYSGGSEWGDWRQATIVRREAAALIGESLTQTDRMEKHDV
jgi:6-O-methylguanine DNA methyltransferase, DNA binding domain